MDLIIPELITLIINILNCYNLCNKIIKELQTDKWQ